MKFEFKKKLDHIILHLGIPQLLKFISISPRIAEFRVTENCNSRCIMCNAWKNKFVNELSTEEMKDILHQLRAFGIDHLIILGGEPLLRPDIGGIIKEASLLKFRTILVTNGLLLEEKAKELLENGITHITVSVDGIGETHDTLRGIQGSFNKAIRGVRIVQKLKKDMNLKVGVTLITLLLTKQNADEIPQLIKLSQDLNVYWDFNLLDCNLDIFRGIPFPKLLIDDEQKIDAIIDYLKTAQTKIPSVMSPVICKHIIEYARRYLKGENLDNYHCVHGYEILHIGSHGEVYACWMMEPIGSLRKDKLENIIGTMKYRELAKRIYMRQCPGCTNMCTFNIIMKHLISHWLFCERRNT